MTSLAVMPAAFAPDSDGRYAPTTLFPYLAATVLTLEGGLIGAQDRYRFTPLQLQGEFCAPPNTCQPVDYPAVPGDQSTAQGGELLMQAVNALPDNGEPVILLGHSQGAQVIYGALRHWQAEPSTAPDPDQLSWVSIGNPDNAYGGIRVSFGSALPVPADTPYQGTEVIRQYDGWADWPDNPLNLLAVLNAVAGMLTLHSDYSDVDLDDHQNVRYTPDFPDGTPGNITYVWVPTPVLPLIAWTGPFAPMLDTWLRPLVESGYDRPVPIPTPEAPPAAPQPVLQSESVAAASAVSIPVDEAPVSDAKVDAARSTLSIAPAQTGATPTSESNTAVTESGDRATSPVEVGSTEPEPVTSRHRRPHRAPAGTEKPSPAAKSGATARGTTENSTGTAEQSTTDRQESGD